MINRLGKLLKVLGIFVTFALLLWSCAPMAEPTPAETPAPTPTPVPAPTPTPPPLGIDYYVSTVGNDANDGHSREKAKHTIEE